jgi:D-amino-acid dehydrogenase
MKVIVLGAGVVGVTTAYFLARNGHQVTVLEKGPACATGCSMANGGQLNYSHLESLTTASSLLSCARSFDLEFWKWFYAFLKNSSKEKVKKNSENLFRLTSYGKGLMAEIIRAEKGLKFHHKNDGILYFYRSQKKFDKAIAHFDSYAFLNRKAQILNAEECVKKEPTLVKLFDEKKLAGGIFYEADASGDAFAFTRVLEAICKEKYGVVFEYNAEIRNILTNRKKITGVNTSKGVYCGDKYVYALGAYGNHLLNGIDINPKIYPVKGYSLSIASDEEFVAPNLAMCDFENKIIYSRIGKIFRVAGSIEIAGLKSGKNKKNIQFLKTAVCSSFSDFGNFNEVKEWGGFQAFRPNNLPLICEAKKYGNLLLNVGHGSLGFVLAASSAKITCDLLEEKSAEEFQFLQEEESEIYV